MTSHVIIPVLHLSKKRKEKKKKRNINNNLAVLPSHDTRLIDVINFIQPYLHQFFNNSHSLKGYGKPSKRPFDQCQSCFEAINIG